MKFQIINCTPPPTIIFFSEGCRAQYPLCNVPAGSRNPLRFRPENGMKVVVTGRVSLFPQDGVYQLYCSRMVPDGVGELAFAFEQLKKSAVPGRFI